ncbi:hypothetical protein AB0D10_11145 [Kitasatospora sp. NPDC048545]|uniref:hypothetical protein n=1 Tax=Kitasatospora sp. NPDC048545 TaxID=3157208 RepID=UPI0033E756A9
MPDPATTTPTDAELAGRIRGGPRQGGQAAEEIAGRHRAAVLAYAALCCRDGRATEELADEALTVTLDAVRAGAGPTDAWRPYLLAAVRRTAAGWAGTGRQSSLCAGFASWLENLPRADPAQPSAEAAAVAAEEASLLLRAFRSLPQSSQADLWQYLGAFTGTQAPATPASAPHPRPDPAARQGLYEAYLQAYVSQTPNRSCRHLVAGLGDSVRSASSGRTGDLDLHLSICGSCARARAELVAIHTWQRAALTSALLLWPTQPSADPSAGASSASAQRPAVPAAPEGPAANASMHRPTTGWHRLPGASPRGARMILTAGAATAVLAIAAVVGMPRPPSPAAPAPQAPLSTATPTTSAPADPPLTATPSTSPTPTVAPTMSATPTAQTAPAPATPSPTATAPATPPASPSPSTANPIPVTPTPVTRPAPPLPGSVPAAIVGDGRYHSLSAGGSGGQALEVNGTCSSQLGSSADINTWWTDHTSEQWTFTTNPDGTVRISDNCDTPTHQHTVLAAGTQPGNSAYLLNYGAGNPWQEWRVMQNTTTGALTITNVATGLTLDTFGTTSGSTVVTNTANGAAPGQSWTLLS